MSQQEKHDELNILPMKASVRSLVTESNGVLNRSAEIVCKSQAENNPLISGCLTEVFPEKVSLEEMEKKYAAYVRHDAYGTMGRGDISIKEKALLVFALLTIVPVKVVLMLAIVCTYYVICRLCTMFWSPSQNGGQEEKDGDCSASPLKEERTGSSPYKADYQNNYSNLHGVRRSIMVHCGRFLSRALLFVLGFYWIEVTYRDNEQDTEASEEEITSKDMQLQPGAIVSNHVSYIDILYHMSASFPSFVAKATVARLPLIGFLSKCLGCIYVQREDKPSDCKGVSGVITERLHACCKDQDGPPMLLFPEGTTTNGCYLLPFRTGAFLAETPVRPVVLKYPYGRLSPAWDTISGVRHIVLLLCQFMNYLEVVWLPVYVPSEEEKNDVKLYANNVRKYMAKEAGLILSDIGLPEKRIYHAFLNGDAVLRS